MNKSIGKGKRLNRYSLNKIAEINAEAPIRVALCRRAHGTPVLHKQTVYHNGTKYFIDRVTCMNGICECGCGQRSQHLDPHEIVHRSQGGKLTMQNTIMVRRDCHHRLQNNIPKWSHGAEE